MNDHSVAQIAPSGSFTGDRQFTVPCNDPLLTAAESNTLLRRASGQRQSPRRPSTSASATSKARPGPRTISEHTDYRFVFGAKGDLGSAWSYFDISAAIRPHDLLAGTTSKAATWSYTHEQNALNVVPGPGGVPTCLSVINGTDKNCVPWNLWTPGGVTPAALSYLTAEGAFGGYVTDQVVTGAITGDLGQYGMKSPWATDGAGISAGAEYQRDFLANSHVDAHRFQSGDLAGRGGKICWKPPARRPPKSIFGEIRVPIVPGHAVLQGADLRRRLPVRRTTLTAAATAPTRWAATGR